MYATVACVGWAGAAHWLRGVDSPFQGTVSQDFGPRAIHQTTHFLSTLKERDPREQFVLAKLFATDYLFYTQKKNLIQIILQKIPKKQSF